MRSIGIDIGTLSIKVADVEGSSQNFVLRDYLEVPFAPDLSQDRKVQTLDVLRRVASHYDPQTTRFVLSISQDNVSVRHRLFPFRERNKIVKSLPYELEDEVPFDSAHAVFDAKILKFREKSSEILTAICPHNYITEILNLANDAGIDPEIITSDGFALSNLITAWDESPPEADSLLGTDANAQTNTEGATVDPDQTKIKPSASLYIQIGHTKTIFIIKHGPIILEIRSLSFGGMNIVTRIQKTYDISYVDALKGLQEKGFVLTKTEGASQDQIIFSKAISTGLDKFLFDVRKTILEIESQFDISVSQVHLLGGLSFLVNLAPYLTQKLGIICNIFNPLLQGFKINTNETIELKKNSAIAIGIAIEGLKKPKNPPINFRKGDFAKEGASFKHFFERWNTTLKYAAAVYVMFFVFSIIKDNLASTMSDKASEVLKKQGALPEVGKKKEADIRKFVKAKKKELAENKKLAHLQYINAPIDIMNQLSNSFPSKKQFPIDVRHLKIENEFATIEGEVSQKNQIDEIRKSLKNVAQNGKIQDTAPSIRPASGKVTFAFSFQVARKNPGAPE